LITFAEITSPSLNSRGIILLLSAPLASKRKREKEKKRKREKEKIF